MPLLSKPKIFIWTSHARAKMAFYKLSESRVRHVLNSPRRVEEGVAPKTFAVMKPASSTFHNVSRAVIVAKNVSSRTVNYNEGISTKSKTNTSKQQETWKQEIWVMYQDSPKERVIISAWRYPGVSKVRSTALINLAKKEYNEFIAS